MKESQENATPTGAETVRIVIPPELAGSRLDKALASLVPRYTRATIQTWIREGRVTMNGEVPKPRDAVSVESRILVMIPAPKSLTDRPQAIPLSVIHEDDEVLVIDKPAGMVVHPGAGNPDDTLLNALLAHDDRLAGLPRAGIVHRLDKGTSGLMVVAKTETARQYLIELLEKHLVWRQYAALVWGDVISGGTIDRAIGRHPVNRLRMAVRGDGKPAVTHYRVTRRAAGLSLLSVRLETGRTHQIRVHLSHAGFPLVGDASYGQAGRIPRDADDHVASLFQSLRRQVLHAERLGFDHPVTGANMIFDSSWPADMQQLCQVMFGEIDELQSVPWEVRERH